MGTRQTPAETTPKFYWNHWRRNHGHTGKTHQSAWKLATKALSRRKRANCQKHWQSSLFNGMREGIASEPNSRTCVLSHIHCLFVQSLWMGKAVSLRTLGGMVGVWAFVLLVFLTVYVFAFELCRVEKIFIQPSQRLVLVWCRRRVFA